MKKTELVAGVMYAYARGNDEPKPARLLDLRLWKKNGRRLDSDPEAWRDVTNEPGARPGHSSGYTVDTVTGYLILTGNGWLASVTAEELAAVEIPKLPEDAKEAAKAIAGLTLPENIGVDLVVTARLRQPWAEYAKEKAVQDTKKAEAARAREQAMKAHADAWATANGRLKALGVDAQRLRLDQDWEAREPRVSLTLAELTKLIDLAEES